MAAPLAILQAGEVGKQLTFTQTNNAPDFTASGVVTKLLVTPAGGTMSAYTCTLSGTTPIYITTGAEFPTQGNYSVQLEYTATGEKYYSPVGTVKVLANLG